TMMGLSKRSSSAAKVQAPKRVVRAVRNYVARESTELTFKKDDFFYVFSTPHDSDEWYDVTNPLTGERGLAPSSFFELSSMMTLRARTTSIQHQHYIHQHQHQRQVSHSLPAVIELHGTALYDFAAANNNELGVREGDDLLIVAQSTEDWLIGRSVLGGKKTALVPAAYVQLHDHVTGAAVSDL
ncbi:hypothetical protein COEREDRAFT_31814, partial [Coemansia reversa NRRL 1564]